MLFDIVNSFASLHFYLSERIFTGKKHTQKTFIVIGSTFDLRDLTNPNLALRQQQFLQSFLKNKILI